MLKSLAPRIERAICLRVRPEPQGVPIRVQYFHFQSPWVVRWSVQDRSTVRDVFELEGLDILDTDPGPRAWVTLTASAEVYASTVAVYGREIVSPPTCVRETQDVRIIKHAYCHVLERG